MIGHQWWWEYHYETYDGKKLGFITANELHIPASEAGVAAAGLPDPEVGRCVPQFLGPATGGEDRPDPGSHQLPLVSDRADRACSSASVPSIAARSTPTCSSAWSSIRPTDFEHWLEHEASPAVDDPGRGRRQGVVPGPDRASTVTGCAARRPQGTYAPDLTHLMSRQTLAAGMVPNTPEELRRWVDDPQQIKPGCLMPAFGLSETRSRSDRRLSHDAPLKTDPKGTGMAVAEREVERWRARPGRPCSTTG